jgi:Tol biopolymer transport system component
MRVFFPLMICMLLFVPVHAQDEPLLLGPLLAATTDEQDRIVLYDIGGGGQRSISFGTGWHMVWGFSADGCRVVYTLSDGPGMARLYSARLDGTDTRALVQFSELPDADWGVWEPQPSPDGSRIAFTMIHAETELDGTRTYQRHIAFIDAAGGAPQFYSVTGDEAEPRWSPDGAWLAYISYTGRVPGADSNATAAPTPEGMPLNPDSLLHEADMWVVSADASVKYQLTNFPIGSVRAPRWSPDGFLVSFIYSPSPNNDTFWMIGNAQGAIPTQLSYQWSLVLDTTWFPDSAAILASARDFQGIPDNFLWKVPLVGNADTDATRYIPDDTLSYADYPRFSPDGRYLALRTSYNLALVDTITQTWSLLDEAALGNTPPVWSPAGFAGEAACI